MNIQSRKKFFALIAASTVSLPLASSLGAHASAGSNASAFIRFTSYAGASHIDTAHLVPLSTAEVEALGLPQAGIYTVDARQASFASPAFQKVWQRTDQLVASGAEKRSWYWGPQPNSAGLQEDYAEGQGGKRLVQYFDKSRMEINDPNGDPNSPFYVTNGLLTVELISGKMQTGNSTYVDRWPADIPLASDPDDANAPTYLSFQRVSNTPLGNHPATPAMNQPVTATIARDGTTGNDPTKATYPDVTVSYFEPITGHNIPKAIWDFLNAQGNVVDPVTGKTVTAPLSNPWFYATGYPISEAYWARVKVAGQAQDVLIQPFQRRVVTYAPNGVPGFKVQMGNIGQHYYDWRYKDAGKPANLPTPVAGPTTPVAGTPAAQPTGTTPAAPTATPTQASPTESCAGVPPDQNATTTPKCGPPGTSFRITAQGFLPNENVGIYVTAPDQSVFGTPQQEPADASGGGVGIGLDTLPGIPAGVFAVSFEGTTSHRKAIGYFKIIAGAESTPTPGGGASTSCNDVPPPVNTTISPSNCDHVGAEFDFLGHGFRPGENVGVYVTDPSQAVVGAPRQFTAAPDGTVGVGFGTLPNFPLGIWAMTMESAQTHYKAIGYFKLIP